VRRQNEHLLRQQVILVDITLLHPNSKAIQLKSERKAADLPSPEAGHDPLLEGLGLDAALNLHVGGVHVSEDLRQLRLHNTVIILNSHRREKLEKFLSKKSEGG